MAKLPATAWKASAALACVSSNYASSRSPTGLRNRSARSCRRGIVRPAAAKAGNLATLGTSVLDDVRHVARRASELRVSQMLRWMPAMRGQALRTNRATSRTRQIVRLTRRRCGGAPGRGRRPPVVASRSRRCSSPAPPTPTPSREKWPRGRSGCGTVRGASSRVGARPRSP